MSTANTHPGLSYNNSVRRYQQQSPSTHPSSSNKPPPSLSSSLSQHASPYQSQQGYGSQQPGYPSHLFNTPPPQVTSVNGTQNGPRQPPQHQVPPALPVTRQRAPPPQQMQTQTLSYLSQTLNPQPLNPQQLSQQTLSHSSISQPSLSQQSLGQQQLGQQPLAQQQTLNQHTSQQHPSQHTNPHPSRHTGQQPLNPQQLSQQSLAQHSLAQQSMSQQQPLTHPSSSRSTQQNDSSIIPQQQSTSIAQAQPALPSVASQVPHMQQLAQQVHQAQAQQAVQQTNPALPESGQSAHQSQRHDEETEMGSPDDSGEGDISMEPKLVEGAAYVARTPKGPMMSAPPEGGSFPTLDDVHAHVQDYCTSVGYAVVIGRSKKTVPGLKKVLFVCDRAGKPPQRVNPELRKRKTHSRKCDCQFGFFAIEQRTQWTVRYRPDAAHLKHNHGPSDSPLRHPSARKLDHKMVAAVKDLKDSGVGVPQTLELLQQANPHVALLPRDIYNARAAINRNPEKVATGLAENRPAIYSKPHPSAEERIRADIRKELIKAREDYAKLKEETDKEIEDLKNQLVQKEKTIEKFEMFIDICNQRVMVQRERLADSNDPNAGVPTTNP